MLSWHGFFSVVAMVVGVWMAGRAASRENLDKDLVYSALKGLGIKVFDEFENANLFEYLTGINKDGSLFHLTSSTSTQTGVTSESGQL